MAYGHCDKDSCRCFPHWPASPTTTHPASLCPATRPLHHTLLACPALNPTLPCTASCPHAPPVECRLTSPRPTRSAFPPHVSLHSAAPRQRR
ncbi:hypothetical protein E2C01_071697 [Portunus trituberculatus]|uniref:Uncharacterized protein n=1 Tax=Portunus trituberculatus TaxID=210409 RepID=A0A5B7I8P2_PORTR|nr:hypothetical protein [Portunus trituberculatus]